MTAPLALTAVAIGAAALLIDGPPGSGKSSLALALIDRGARLIGDDGVVLAARDGRLRASPAPATRGLLEVRNVGLIHLPAAEDVGVALLVRLSTAAPRFIESAASEMVAGIVLPVVELWPESPVLALRAEWALRKYGLAIAPE